MMYAMSPFVIPTGQFCITDESILKYCEWGCCSEHGIDKCCEFTSVSEIAGAVIGGVGLLAIIGAIVVCCLCCVCRQRVTHGHVIRTTVSACAQNYIFPRTELANCPPLYPLHTSIMAPGVTMGTTIPWQPPSYEEATKLSSDMLIVHL
ncbi:uncharacterized protein LOC127873606 [Dreissena polymorpha]|uniref:Uncharacterized protein n=1 Tax=Dreissena polymorpha TaxID=45954 RepID=A0A9D4LFE7_DREPO|nr:uncharacterized protein LOC127873606 [Dreissena polymorpha]KAH3856743.1 hypothetical protein DPMN_099337 [Dreissena polymorpha]